MKKILAVFLLSLLVFSLSSCFVGEIDSTRDDIPTYRQDEGGVYYTALDIGVKSYLYENENGETKTQFELLVGVRSTVGNDILLDADAEKTLGELINRKTGMNFEYFGIDSVGTCRGEGFKRYSFMLKDQPNILNETDRKFGFFFIKRNFTLNNPAWVASIENSVHGAAEELFGGLINRKVKIDNDAIRLRYYFAANNGFYADNAVEVYDPVNAIGFFMWEDTDITELPMYYKAMASGWYILPIIAGIIVVVILTFTHKGKKNERESVFLTSPQANEENDAPVNQPVNSESDVIEGQVTMEEVLNSDMSENENG